MRLLDRYLLRELLVPLTYCMAGFIIFWLSADLLSSLEDLQKQKLGGLEVLEYHAARLPDTLVFVLPVALLLALLYTLTNLARHNELTAMRAAGVSLLRLSMPYLGAGFLFSLVSLAVNEMWGPAGMERAEEILHRHDPRQQQAGSGPWVRKLGFTNLRDNRKWLVEAYNTVTSDMVGPHVEWPLPDGTRRELSAERGAYVEGVWTFTNAQQFFYPAETGQYPRKVESAVLSVPEFSETPDEIRSEIKVSKMNVRQLKSMRKTQISIREMLDYQRLHPETSGKRAMLDTKLHGRLAAPWTCLVVVLIALPFGAMSGRRNVFVGVASSIVICFVFFVLRELTLALGTGGYVAPWLAAWAPNMAFAGLSTFLVWRAR